MMKLPKNYFSNLSTSKYREYLKLLPSMQQENTRIIVTLIFTFFAISFFGIFAINPTLSTIVNLRRQLSDSELVYESLKTKISNLSSLQQQYSQLSPDLPIVFEAVPQEVKAPTLLSQIIGLAKEKQVAIVSYENSDVQLFGSINPIADATQNQLVPGEEDSYTFSLKAVGTYENLMVFTKSLTQISRIIRIESLTISKDEKQNSLALDIDGRTYFRK